MGLNAFWLIKPLDQLLSQDVGKNMGRGLGTGRDSRSNPYQAVNCMFPFWTCFCVPKEVSFVALTVFCYIYRAKELRLD